jgi:hypothetical protein
MFEHVLSFSSSDDPLFNGLLKQALWMSSYPT